MLNSKGPEHIGNYHDWAHGSGNIIGTEFQTLNFEQSLAFISQSNSRDSNGNWKSGGLFQSSKSGFTRGLTANVSVFPGVYRDIPEYKGCFTVAIPPEFPMPVLRPIEAIGVELWGQAAPAQPQIGLANALYELKDLPGMLRQRFLDEGLYSIFDYFLALKFGWEPLLRDCRNLYFTAANLKKQLDQLLRDNGRPVRRRVERPLKRETTLMEYIPCVGYPTWMNPILTSYCYGDNTNSYFKSELVSEYREWFSARFRYWLPNKGNLTDWEWKRWMVARLMGLNPTPGVIWNAMPWSWLVDWFGNVGDAINNLDYGVADRLIADYAYVMGSQRDSIRYTGTGTFHTSPKGGMSTLTATSEWYISHKRRYPATPFGFGLTDSDLSATQAAILGSLGGARLR